MWRQGIISQSRSHKEWPLSPPGKGSAPEGEPGQGPLCTLLREGSDAGDSSAAAAAATRMLGGTAAHHATTTTYKDIVRHTNPFTNLPPPR